MKTPIGLLGLSGARAEVWMRLAIMSRAWRWPMTRLVERVAELEDRLDLVLDHAPDGDAGPVRDDGGRRPGHRRWGGSAEFSPCIVGELGGAAS